MKGWNKIWGTPVRNKKIWDWIGKFKKNNELVKMWLIKNYQAICEIKKFYFIFCIYKMYLISAEGYKKADVLILIIKKTGKIWASMKNVQDGLGVKNMSDLILKEICSIYETKNFSKLKNTKWLKEKFLKNMII